MIQFHFEPLALLQTIFPDSAFANMRLAIRRHDRFNIALAWRVISGDRADQPLGTVTGA